MCNDESIENIFLLIHRFEKASNAKLNLKKTEGLWIGTWRDRTDKPLNLDWKNTPVKFLGVYVGNKCENGEKILNTLNFADTFEKITKKVNFWKGRVHTIRGRIKVVNTFILSKLWYRTECCDLNHTQIERIDNLVLSYIWNGRKDGRVLKHGLKDLYANGGLQLVDVNKKILTQRLKWIESLYVGEDDFGKHVVDNIIGKFNLSNMNDNMHQIEGLEILNYKYQTQHINKIKNVFYHNCLKQWIHLEVKQKPKDINCIQSQYIYDNFLLVDENRETFKYPREILRKRYPQIPYVFSDLPFNLHRKGKNKVNKETFIKIKTMNTAFDKLEFSLDNREIHFFLNADGKSIPLSITFKKSVNFQ